MGKYLTFSVAGSGKTTRIIRSLDLSIRNLVLTYTHANTETIKSKLISQYGEIPENVKVSPFTSFLYSSCFRPIFHDIAREKGLTFNEPERSTAKKNSIEYYTDFKRYVYHCRMGLSFIELNQKDDLFARLERFYDHIYIDEVQDLAARDFDFILLLGKSNLNIDLIGDFFQHTYDSSRDGQYLGNLFEEKTKYVNKLRMSGYELHPEQLTKSYRCSPIICEFVQNQIGINIESHRVDATNIKYVENESEANELRNNDSIVKLFFQNHHLHGCFSRNWGDCKGEDRYESVCVVLNKTTDDLFRAKKLRDLAPTSKNKLYVAITRARGDVFLCPPKYFMEPIKAIRQKQENSVIKKKKIKEME